MAFYCICFFRSVLHDDNQQEEWGFRNLARLEAVSSIFDSSSFITGSMHYTTREVTYWSLQRRYLHVIDVCRRRNCQVPRCRAAKSWHKNRWMCSDGLIARRLFVSRHSGSFEKKKREQVSSWDIAHAEPTRTSRKRMVFYCLTMRFRCK